MRSPDNLAQMEQGQMHETSVSSRYAVTFWLGFWCIYAKFILQCTTLVLVPDMILSVLLFFGLLFLAIRIYTLYMDGMCSKWVWISLLLGGVSYALSGDTVYLTTFLLLSAAIGVNANVIVERWALATAAVLVFMLLLYLFDILTGSGFMNEFKNIGGLLADRNALLFNHPNYCAAYFLGLSIAVLCLKKAGTFLKVLTCTVSLLVILLVAGSRTSAISLVVAIMFYLAYSLRGAAKMGRMRAWIPYALPLLFTGVTYWMASGWFRSPFFSQSIVNLLSARPNLWFAQDQGVGLTLLGQEAFRGVMTIRGASTTVMTIDSFYAWALFSGGILMLVVFYYLYCRTIRESMQKGHWGVVVALSAIAVFGFTEWHAINVFVCIPLVFLSEALIRRPADNRASSVLGQSRDNRVVQGWGGACVRSSQEEGGR